MVWTVLQALGKRLPEGPREGSRRVRCRSGSADPRDSTRPSRRRPGCERLEDRTLLATPGYDYVLSGYQWLNPARITYSIAPDGVFWDRGTNILNASFNARLGAGRWQAEIARALATWQSVANINIVPVSDGMYDFNYLGLAQGAPEFGDIRFGGYVFPNQNATTLAQTFFPPPNGSTAPGDVEINTTLNFNIGATYDLYSVMLHETGHSLGLEHAPNPSVVMAANYGGVRSGLTTGDIAGIQAIYGARSLDVYQRQGLGTSPALPIDVSAALATGSQATVSNLAVPSIGSSEFFTFQAPGDATGSLRITAAAANISMLSPRLRVFDDRGALLGEASNRAAWSNDVIVTVANVEPGRRYSIVVSGATGDVFDVGAYALRLDMPQRPATPAPPSTPPVSPPTVPISPIIGPDPYEPNGTLGTAAWLGRISQTTLTGLTLVTRSDVDYFAFSASRTSTYRVTASGVWVQVYNARGRLIAQGSGQVGLPTQKTGSILYVRTSAVGDGGVSSYALSISSPSPVTFWRSPSRRGAPRFGWAALRR